MTDCDPRIFATHSRRISEFYIELLACAKGLLAETVGGPVCSAAIYTGEAVTWDRLGLCDGASVYGDADDCGQLFVLQRRAFNYETFPLASQLTGCNAPLAFQFELGVLRCYPEPDVDDPLSDDEVSSLALAALEDQAALYQALSCCRPEGTRPLVAANEWESLGPNGGAAGGRWLVTVDPTG